MSYHILTAQTIQNYLNQTPTLKTLLGEGEWKITEIGDGNLNYIYHVQSAKNNLIIKQALPYLLSLIHI